MRNNLVGVWVTVTTHTLTTDDLGRGATCDGREERRNHVFAFATDDFKELKS